MNARGAARLALAATAMCAAWYVQITAMAQATPAGAPQVTVLLVIDVGDAGVQRSFWVDYLDARSRLAHLIDRSFLARLGPRDRVRVGGFGPRLTLSNRYTTDKREAAAAVLTALTPPTADRYGASPIWDVVAEALIDVSTIASEVVGTKIVNDRRAVVLMTDGESTGNLRSYTDVLAEAIARGIPIHVVSTAIDVVIPQAFDQVLRSRPTTRLRQLAEATGGLFLQPRDAAREYRPQLEWEGFESYRKARTHTELPRWDRDPGAAFAQIADHLGLGGRAAPRGIQPSAPNGRP